MTAVQRTRPDFGEEGDYLTATARQLATPNPLQKLAAAMVVQTNRRLAPRQIGST